MRKIPKDATLFIEFENILIDSGLWYRTTFIERWWRRLFGKNHSHFPDLNKLEYAPKLFEDSGVARSQSYSSGFTKAMQKLKNQGFQTTEPDRTFAVNSETESFLKKYLDNDLSRDLVLLSLLPKEVWSFFSMVYFDQEEPRIYMDGAEARPTTISSALGYQTGLVFRGKNSKPGAVKSQDILVTTNPTIAVRSIQLSSLSEEYERQQSQTPCAILLDREDRIGNDPALANYLLANSQNGKLVIIRSLDEIQL